MFARTTRTSQTYQYYQCSSQVAKLLPEQWCRGSVRVEEADARVWGAVLSVLNQPEQIAEEVEKRCASLEEQEASLVQEQRAIESVLARCDREEQRWAEAYAVEVINLAELKAYRAEIAERRRDLQTELELLESQRQTMQRGVAEVARLVEYCRRGSGTAWGVLGGREAAGV
ncbi:MAG: hypothetical protein HYZ81_10070 [Nitrospinae bacterium]|nr:hypothetical protein [Nitrospinota bacterium]